MNQSILDRISTYQKVSDGCLVFLISMQAVALSLFFSGCLHQVTHLSPNEAGFFFFLLFSIFFYFSRPRFRKNPSSAQLQFFLHIKNPSVSSMNFSLQEEIRKKTLQFEKDRLVSALRGLIIPLLLVSTILTPVASLFSDWGQAWKALVLQEVVSLEIPSGVDPLQPASWRLSTRSPPLILLQAENLLALQIKTPGTSPLSVSLKKPKNQEEIQSFQMTPMDVSLHSQTLSFSLTESADLLIPELSERPYAHFQLAAPLIPIVTLTTTEKAGQEHIDTHPLALSIQVNSTRPLRILSLQVTTSDQTIVDPVQTFASDQALLSYSGSHNFFAESFLHEERSEIELVAVAEDFSSPTPAVGKSKPIKITFVSAYSRYQKTLRELSRVKEQVDALVEKNETKIEKNLIDLMKQAYSLSKEAPFFDAPDRHWLEQAAQKFQSFSTQKPDFSSLYDLSQEITHFLDDHEFSDDRDRDRDFFVAAHSISQMLSQRLTQETTLQHVIQRTGAFLQNRYARWNVRVHRLSPAYPVEMWEKIKTHILETRLREILAVPPAKRQFVLSDLTDTYRNWIEALEKAEDAQRESQEKKRKEGLVSARNELRDIQQLQGEISTALDRADQQNLDKLTLSWPSTLAKETQATLTTKRLAKKLLPLSPPASERLQAAAEAMEHTIQHGEAHQFTEAESFSHFANRLLREAKNASQEGTKSTKKKQAQGGAYHGQPIHGGDMDLRHTYRVEEQFREALLRELQEQEYTPQEQQLIEPYLRKMIR